MAQSEITIHELQLQLPDGTRPTMEQLVQGCATLQTPANAMQFLLQHAKSLTPEMCKKTAPNVKDICLKFVQDMKTDKKVMSMTGRFAKGMGVEAETPAAPAPAPVEACKDSESLCSMVKSGGLECSNQAVSTKCQLACGVCS